jgi:hypothetical protein
LEAKNCGFAPAALRREDVVAVVRLKAKNCGFTPAALKRERLVSAG